MFSKGCKFFARGSGQKKKKKQQEIMMFLLLAWIQACRDSVGHLHIKTYFPVGPFASLQLHINPPSIQIDRISFPKCNHRYSRAPKGYYVLEQKPAIRFPVNIWQRSITGKLISYLTVTIATSSVMRKCAEGDGKNMRTKRTISQLPK